MPIPAGYHEAIQTPKATRGIEALWSFSAKESGSAIVLPDGRCDVILRNHINRPDQITPIITGPATQMYRVEYDTGDQWFGVRLRPEQGATLWADDLNIARDRVLRGDDALHTMPALAQLKGRALTLDALAQVTRAAICGNIDQRLTRAIDMLHASGGRLRVDNLAQQQGGSTRHLHRLFQRNTGLAAKTYAQLVQFHRTLGLLMKGRLPITAAAFEGGYADHAHLTRAFRRFGGFKPSALPPELALPTLFSAQV